MSCGAGVEVQFSYSAFVARYPEFTAVQQDTAQEYFNEATIYWANPSLVVSKPVIQSTLLNMLTAHIAALYSQSRGDPEPGQPKDANTPVGRISNATEGSVTVALEYDATNPQEWFSQTKYGASFWAATATYRTMRYVPGQLQPGGFGGYGGLGGYPSRFIR